MVISLIAKIYKILNKSFFYGILTYIYSLLIHSGITGPLPQNYAIAFCFQKLNAIAVLPGMQESVFEKLSSNCVYENLLCIIAILFDFY